jgi:hypothetical protein
VVGDLIPTFTLGIPGSVTGAILMGALILQGIEPGPRFLMMGAMPYTVFAGMVLAQATFLISGVLLGKFFIRVVYLPNAIIAPIIAVLTFLGAFAERNNQFDIFLALVFGLLGYTLDKLKYPAVCLVLGLIMGPLVEANFHRSLGISFGSYSIFFHRPITVIMLALTLLFLIGPYMLYVIKKWAGKTIPVTEAVAANTGEKEGTLGELILLSVMTFILVLFLITARDYSPGAALFPNLVSAAGLIFILWRFLIIVRHLSLGGLNWIRSTALLSGKMSWQWSAALMGACILSMYVLGFIMGSILFVVAVINLSGDRKWVRSIIIGISTAVAMYFLAKIVHLQLPLGFLEVIR